jgi:hypothetical protein
MQLRSQFTLALVGSRGRRPCASAGVDVRCAAVTPWADGLAVRAPDYPAIDGARAGPARPAVSRE